MTTPSLSRPTIALLLVVLLAGGTGDRTPESELAAVVKAYLGLPQPADWGALERLPGIRWAPLPPTSLRNCLPDGGCFTRQGAATLGGRSLVVIATGARTMVTNIFFRNGGAPIGEPAVLAALEREGLKPELARCPVRGSAGSTNWYRLSGSSPGMLSIQAARAGRANEGFVLSHGSELPKLQPNQLALYSTQCTAGQPQAPVATGKPHELLAQALVALLVPASATGHTWEGLASLQTGIKWLGEGPQRTNLSFRNDPNPMARSGTVTWAEREFSVQASGTASQVKNIYFEEMGMHPRGEHVLGVVYEKGIAVRLVRCGPVYTESTNNWYQLTSSGTRPAMVRQSIRYEGNNVQDAYELRLDGSLPARDPRDRNPGTGGC